MPEFCTCGAQPPSDARFCHKCGRPLYELAVPEESEEEAALPAPPPVIEPAGPLPINFQNAKAVRAAVFTASIMFFLLFVPLPPPFHLVMLAGGGFLSTVFYRRWTGESLTPRAGARLGWLTGLMSFVFLLPLLTLMFVVLANTGDIAGQIRSTNANDPNVQQMLNDPNAKQFFEFIQKPSQLALLLALLLPLLFLIATTLPSLGGLLAAKLLKRTNAH